VIDVLTRKSHIVSALCGNGVIVVDTNREAMESDFEILVDYLDPTNFFYHHSKFGEGQHIASEAFRDYMSALEEQEEHIKYHAQRLTSHYKYGSVGENKGFSISACDCCGTKLHGERYEWDNAGLK